MTSYFLLRDNQQSGPFSLQELLSKGLFTTDLIWIEGDSKSWKNAGEIDDLQAHVKVPTMREAKKVTSQVSLDDKQVDDEAIIPSVKLGFTTPVSMQTTPEYQPTLEELRFKFERRRERKNIWQKPGAIAGNFFGLVVLILGVSMGAFMVKKAVDNLDVELLITATADSKDLNAETLPTSLSHHTAMAMLPSAKTEDIGGIKSADTIALASKPKPLTKTTVQNNAVADLKTEATTAVQASHAASDEQATTEASFAANNHTDGETNPVEKPKEIPQLQLSVNDYRVGFLGGISNLEIAVSNPSTVPVSKAIVEVEYLKPNGKVAGTQTVEVSGIAPGSSKKIAVPNSSRGVNVRYKLLTVET